MSKNTLVEKLASILAEVAPDEGYKFYERVAREICNLLKEELKRGRPTLEEIENLWLEQHPTSFIEAIRLGSEYTIKELKDKLG